MEFSNLQDMFIIYKSLRGTIFGLNLKMMATTRVFSMFSPLILILEVLLENPTFRKSWAGSQARIAKLKSSYNSLIVGSRGLGYESNL